MKLGMVTDSLAELTLAGGGGGVPQPGAGAGGTGLRELVSGRPM